MSSEENNHLNNEDRLKGIAYQFLKLYERWAEDRQVLNKNMAAFEELLQIFINELKDFAKLEGQVRDQILNSIEKGAKHVSCEIGKMVGDSIIFEVDLASLELKKRVNEANELLKIYQEREKKSLLVTMSITIGTAIVSSLFIVWLFMPKPTLPLTDEQITTYHNGQLFNKIWPQLSKKEQKHLTDLVKAPDAAQNNSAL